MFIPSNMNDTSRSKVSYYIGPGTDLVFQSFGAIAAFVTGLLAVLGLIAGSIIGYINKNKKIMIIVLVLLIVILFMILFNTGRKDNKMRVIVIGIDGMDPQKTEEMMKNGRLPNFTKMAQEGSYNRLATTNPPQSPVAWASFITGCNPGRHGIFDFLKRNPEDYMPDLSLTNIKEPGYFKLGGIKIPLGSSKISSAVKGTPFWEILSKEKINCEILRCPMTFPPEKLNGKMLSGLGTPDICGTQGTFTFYTTKKIDAKRTGGRVVTVQAGNDSVKTEIIGPRNTALKPPDESRVRLDIELSRQDNRATIKFQDKQFALNAGQWSDWKKVEFQMGGFAKANGICRFYLRSVAPDFELYMSPINFDPEKPAFQVSYPSSYSKTLAKRLGLFHTLG
ncbi:MAG: alkaline phosphatase family protein, partial [bacterium]